MNQQKTSLFNRLISIGFVMPFLAMLTVCSSSWALGNTATRADLATRLAIGDVVFIRVTALPFKKVAEATNSWTNHVGIVTSVSGDEPTISESTFPFSRKTTFSKFVARSEAGRVAVLRPNTALTAEQNDLVEKAAEKRMGIFYDTGFNLYSKRQFCSRFVWEVLREATGVEVGEKESFATLISRRPDLNLAFWRVWYFGKIPWQRETITPASVLSSHNLHPEFDGYVLPQETSVSAPGLDAGRV